MEDELREKIYQMHGTVQRLEEKTDSMIERQGRLDGEIENLDNEVDKVARQAKSNQRKLYGVFLLGSAGATGATVFLTFVSTGFP